MTNDNPQLSAWTGEFGDEYIQRNQLEEWKLPHGIRAFSTMLKKAENLQSTLEVGANIGLNQFYLQNLPGQDLRLHAVEPNLSAFRQLNDSRQFTLQQSWNCDASKLPLEDSSVDLAFTAGVLIHIAPENLLSATSEIVRISSGYILCAEYFSHSPIEVSYQNKESLLFKRDFGKYYLDNFPMLKCIDYGFLWQEDYPNFDNMNWWLFEKA